MTLAAAATAALPSAGDYAVGVLKVVIMVAFLVVAWVVIDRITAFDDEKELFDKRNVAYAVVRISFVIAQAVALLPLLTTDTGSLWTDIRPLLGWGAGATVVLLALNVVFDRTIRHHGGAATLAEESLADSVIKGGFYIASGLIINAALFGTAPDLTTAVLSTLVFGVLGMAALLLGYQLLGFLGPFRRRKELGEDNTAASVVSAGVVIGLGFMLRLAIAGDFDGWAAGIVGFLVTFVLGYVLLIVLMFAVDLAVVRSRTLAQIVAQNEVVAAAVMASMLIAVGLSISSVTI